MEIVLALIAFAVLILGYVFLLTRSRAAIDAARRERNALYRGCFLRGLAGLLARMAKADGTVTRDEVNVAARLFNDMGLAGDDRDLCYDTFRAAIDSNLPISYYASIFAPYSSASSRRLAYEILWDVTAADGRLAAGEAETLRRLVTCLSLDETEYARNEKRVAGKLVGLSDAARAAGAKVDRVLGDSAL